MALDSGAQPVVLSKIDSPINLKVDARDSYYRNEAGSMQTWLTNAQTGSVERGDYRLRARVALPGELASSETYVDLARDEATGQFFLAMPAGLQAAFAEGGLPDAVAVEIVAQSDTDPWFLRRSEPFDVTFRPPLVHWRLPGPVDRRLPGIANPLEFGGDFDESLYRETGFEVLPKLTLTVERYDEKSGQFGPYYETTQEVSVTDDMHRFLIPLDVSDERPLSLWLSPGRDHRGRACHGPEPVGYAARRAELAAAGRHRPGAAGVAAPLWQPDGQAARPGADRGQGAGARVQHGDGQAATDF